MDKEAVGWEGGACWANFMTVNELDVTNNWKQSFEWHGYDHIRLNESTITGNSLKQRCNNNWDFM